MELPQTFSPFSACLYCGQSVESFEPGPKGGASQNMTCRGCGARYNLAVIVGTAVRFSSNPAAAEVLGHGPGHLFLEVLSGPVDAA